MRTFCLRARNWAATFALLCLVTACGAGSAERPDHSSSPPQSSARAATTSPPKTPTFDPSDATQLCALASSIDFTTATRLQPWSGGPASELDGELNGYERDSADTQCTWTGPDQPVEGEAPDTPTIELMAYTDPRSQATAADQEQAANGGGGTYAASVVPVSGIGDAAWEPIEQREASHGTYIDNSGVRKVFFRANDDYYVMSVQGLGPADESGNLAEAASRMISTTVAKRLTGNASPSAPSTTSPSTATGSARGIVVPGPLGPYFANSASVDPSTLTRPDGLVDFDTPSANIYCLMNYDKNNNGASCTIHQYTFSESALSNCPGTDGSIMVFKGTSSPSLEVDCDYNWSGDRTGSRVLQYGQSVRVGEMACAAASAQLTCAYVASGLGFTLTRNSLRRYNM